MPLPWKWLIIPGWLSHGVPVYLVQSLLDDLRARQKDPSAELEYTETDTVSCAIDYPGMICVDRPWSTFKIDGLTIEIPCEDVASFYSQLKDLPPREFKEGKGMGVGMTYFKLKGFCKCLVLTPDIRVELLEALAAGMSEAEAKATAFWADRKAPSDILREAAAASSGLPLEKIPDLGGHKVDRFAKPVKKGDA